MGRGREGTGPESGDGRTGPHRKGKHERAKLRSGEAVGGPGQTHRADARSTAIPSTPYSPKLWGTLCLAGVQGQMPPLMWSWRLSGVNLTWVDVGGVGTLSAS